jgi:hypothetical protein
VQLSTASDALMSRPGQILKQKLLVGGAIFDCFCCCFCFGFFVCVWICVTVKSLVGG